MRRALVSGLAAAAVAVAGCRPMEESPAGAGSLRTVTVALAGPSAAGPSAALLSLSVDGNVSVDAVAALTVTVNGVEVRRADADGPWIPLEVVGGTVTIDLMDLGATPVVVARGELEEGDYVDARLRLEPVDASAPGRTVHGTITLSQSVCLGIADGNPSGQGTMCLEAGDHPVTIPSASETGIKTDAHFTVGASDTEVTLVFDPDATVRTIVWAPGLGVLVNPVIRAANGAGD